MEKLQQPASAASLYPSCPHAIAWCEEPAAVPFWNRVRATHGEGVLEVAMFAMKESVQHIIGREPYMAEIQAEMETADFRRYVAGKLGMM